jgi:nucleoside 2-deoxyribosyltransferase
VTFQTIAILSGDRQKTIPNRTEAEVLSEIVLPFLANGVITAKWGAKVQSYQVLELRIYETKEPWNKVKGPISDVIKRRKNVYKRFGDKAAALLSSNKPKVFIITPIQGEKHGDQEQQRIFKEYDLRFEAIEGVISDAGAVAIRIDKEHALEDLVGRIKKEIRGAQFVVADMTDERPSCYFEAGFAEALGRKVIYVASKQSVAKPGTPTKIHFDIHMNMNFFSNHDELKEKLSKAIEKNRHVLFGTNDAQLS